jgi:hypothetical protein
LALRRGRTPPTATFSVPPHPRRNVRPAGHGSRAGPQTPLLAVPSQRSRAHP